MVVNILLWSFTIIFVPLFPFFQTKFSFFGLKILGCGILNENPSIQEPSIHWFDLICVANFVITSLTLRKNNLNLRYL